MSEPTSETPGLAVALRDDPHSFRFFQAVRLLERLLPDRASVGRFEDPSREVVRFGANPDLSFPGSEIHDLDERSDAPWKMTVNFLGLVGHLGVLPHHYSVLVKRRIKRRDRALLDFMDLFHHRVISLFYRAMERSRFYVPYERGEEDLVSSRLCDFLGLGEEAARDAMDLDVSDVMGYAGLLGPATRSAAALEQMIEDHFEVPAVVEQFVGGWYDVSVAAQCSLDDSRTEYSQQLGAGALVGDEVWDPQARARIVLGPLSRERYEEFLPTGSAYQKLRAMAQLFSGDEVEFELRLLLERDEVRPFRLGADDASPLGWGSWIRSGPRPPATAETALTL